MRDFIHYEEIPETFSDELVNVKNELNVDINIEDVNELIESYSVPKRKLLK